MYGARNQLFASSCFARDENSRITRCDFGDARDYALQRRRCSNDLFEHRGFVDFFSQSDVFLLQSFLCSLAIVDVYGGRIETLDLSLFVPQWDATGEEPTISSVAFAQSQLHLLNGATGKGTIKSIAHAFPVIRMKVHIAIRRVPPLFETTAKVIERNAVGIKAIAVGSVHRNNLRREVQHLPELRFLLADFVLRPLAIFDVGRDPIPLDDVSIIITERYSAVQLPAILPIRTAATHLTFVRFAGSNRFHPFTYMSLKVIRVN